VHHSDEAPASSGTRPPRTTCMLTGPPGTLRHHELGGGCRELGPVAVNEEVGRCARVLPRAPVGSPDPAAPCASKPRTALPLTGSCARCTASYRPHARRCHSPLSLLSFDPKKEATSEDYGWEPLTGAIFICPIFTADRRS
jgi:hypothetical protein